MLERHKRMRRDIIALSHHSNSAHLGSGLSCVEVMDALVTISTLTPETAGQHNQDVIIISKGHAAMAYYVILSHHGMLDKHHLDTYLQNDTLLWGHVSTTVACPAIDYSSGSLGHGLGIACGHALGYKLRGIDKTVYVLLSDGECNEGSVWEAALFAQHHKLDNIVVVVDYNKIQSIGHCQDVLNPEPVLDKWRAFNWHVTDVDGHDYDAAQQALSNRVTGKPMLVLAHTVKGRGVSHLEGTVSSHYKPALAEDLEIYKDA